MMLFNFLNKSSKYPTKKESDVAEHLKLIIHSIQKGNINGVSEDIINVAKDIYELSFTRSNKKYVPLDNLNIFNVIENTKIVHYVGIFKAIRNIVENTCKNSAVLASNVTVKDCEDSLFIILEQAVKNLNALK